METLLNISPIDGRYKKQSEALSPYLSEFALIKYRTVVEVKWLIYLLDKNIIDEKITKKDYSNILKIAEDFDVLDAKRVKEIESVTNHDVKAVEYFLREKLESINLNKLIPFIHITLTSEDINNVSYNLMFKDALNNVYYKKLDEFISLIDTKANEYKSVPMLSHTHGQAATPTTVGKELKVFSYRIKSVLDYLKNISLKSKFSGAVGNYNCHVVAYPNISWIEITKEFVESLDLEYNPVTTQIESHDILCLVLSHIKIINNIIKDFNSDMWLYISRNYFCEIKKESEVGSSVMPHKINPINHENSMANIELANSLIDGFVNNLSISRMQRDLTDSSKMRNLGVVLSHSLISLSQSIIAINKMSINEKLLKEELDSNYVVLTEAVQTVLRKNKVANAYELLKELARGKELTKEELEKFINDLPILPEDKERLLKLTPESYIGLAEVIVDNN